MISWVLILSASLGAGEVERDGVKVRTTIESNRYTWDVTNVDVEPIMRFEIAVWNMYAPEAPPGWVTDLEDHSTIFRAWTDDRGKAIHPGRDGRFRATVTTKEAQLGTVALEIGTGDGTEIVLDGVWGASPLPRSQAFLVAGVVAGLAVLHWLVARTRS